MANVIIENQTYEVVECNVQRFSGGHAGKFEITFPRELGELADRMESAPLGTIIITDTTTGITLCKASRVGKEQTKYGVAPEAIWPNGVTMTFAGIFQ